MVRKIICCLIVTLLALTNVTIISAHEFDEKLTFYQYVDFLQSMVEQEELYGITQLNNNNNEVTTRDVLNAVLALSFEEREEFMYRLYRPETWDVVVRNLETTATDKNDMPLIARNIADGTWVRFTAQPEREFSLLGVPLIIIRQTFVYDANYRISIREIRTHDPHVHRNWSPMSQVVLADYDDWVDIVANGRFRFSYSIGPVYGLSVQTANIHGVIAGDSGGRVVYRMWLD